jgi:hypothetical protein
VLQGAGADDNLAHVAGLAHLAQRSAHSGQVVHDVGQRAQRARCHVSRQAGQGGVDSCWRQEVNRHQRVAHIRALCRQAKGQLTKLCREATCHHLMLQEGTAL